MRGSKVIGGNLARFAGCALILFAAHAASAQAPAHLTPEQIQAVREMSLPTGVGGCVYRALPMDLAQDLVTRLMKTGELARDQLQAATAKVAQDCTGYAYSASDTALASAVTGSFLRLGASLSLATGPAIGARGLDDAWEEATAEERAPFDAAAEAAVRGQSPASNPGPAALAPFERRLKLDPAIVTPDVQRMLLMFYAGGALSMHAEAALAAKGATFAR
jgi:hypothetical protein